MPKIITEFALTSGKILKVPSVKKDASGKEKTSNYYQWETLNRNTGEKNAYGSFHQEIASALGITDKVVPGCLVTVTVQIFERPEEVAVETTVKNQF